MSRNLRPDLTCGTVGPVRNGMSRFYPNVLRNLKPVGVKTISCQISTFFNSFQRNDKNLNVTNIEVCFQSYSKRGNKMLPDYAGNEFWKSP